MIFGEVDFLSTNNERNIKIGRNWNISKVTAGLIRLHSRTKNLSKRP